MNETERAMATVLKEEVKLKMDILWDIHYFLKGHMPRMRLIELMEENEDDMKAWAHLYDGHPAWEVKNLEELK